MANYLAFLHEAASKARNQAHHIASRARNFAEDADFAPRLVDVSVQFIGARGLPKMDVVGTADPYFVATIDNEISFTSNVKPNNLSPVWNENWYVKNVPDSAALKVKVMDKDEGQPVDDTIGVFETTISNGAKEVEIVGQMLKQVKGTFWLNITTTPAAHPHLSLYTFDGPIRYSRHFSPTIGRLTCINDERLYSTWKLHIKGVTLFFGDTTQHWNTTYRAAQTIFQGTASVAVRASIVAGHRMLYARSTRNGFGTIESKEDIYSLLCGGHGGGSSVTRRASLLSSADSSSSVAPSTVPGTHRVKPAVYTYVIAADDTLRFSETGAAFFVDFASKHALHAACAESVRYSGEFHPRPTGGWENFGEEIPDEAVEWELVVDNNSGTYAPDPALLPVLQALLEYNFPGFRIVALDFKDPELERSREACREYALKYRGVKQDELQPHTHDAAEETLQHRVSVGQDTSRSRSRCRGKGSC